MFSGLLCRRKQRITHRESLAGIPIMNPAAILASEHGRKLIILQTARRSPSAGYWSTWLARLQPLRPSRRFALDDAGAEVLALMDGQHTVEQLIQTYGSKRHLPRETAEYAVTTFLRTLLQRNIAAVVVPPPPAIDAHAFQLQARKKGSEPKDSATLNPEP